MEQDFAKAGIFDWTPEERARARNRKLRKRNKVISLILFLLVAVIGLIYFIK